MGIVYTELLDYDKAVESHKKALAIFQRSQAHEYIAGVLHNLGNAELARRDYPAAAAYYDQAAEIKVEHSTEPASLESTLRMQAVAHANAGNYAKAVEALRGAYMCTLGTGPRNAAYLTSLAHHELVKPLLQSGGEPAVLLPLANRLRDIVETVAKRIQQEKNNFNAPVGEEQNADQRLLVFYLLVRYARLIEALAAGRNGAEEQAIAAWLKEVSGDDLDLTYEFPAGEKGSEKPPAAAKKAKGAQKGAAVKGKTAKKPKNPKKK